MLYVTENDCQYVSYIDFTFGHHEFRIFGMSGFEEGPPTLLRAHRNLWKPYCLQSLRLFHDNVAKRCGHFLLQALPVSAHEQDGKPVSLGKLRTFFPSHYEQGCSQCVGIRR